MHPYGKQILFAYILYHGFSSANHSVNTLRDTCHKYDIAFVCINAFIVHNKAKRAIAQLNCRLTQSLLLSWTVNRLAGVASFSGRPVRGAEGCAFYPRMLVWSAIFQADSRVSYHLTSVQSCLLVLLWRLLAKIWVFSNRPSFRAFSPVLPLGTRSHAWLSAQHDLCVYARVRT